MTDKGDEVEGKIEYLDSQPLYVSSDLLIDGKHKINIQIDANLGIVMINDIENFGETWVMYL